MNRLARAPALINKALDRGHVRLALLAMGYISREHRGPVLASIRSQLSFAFPTVMAGKAVAEKRGSTDGRAAMIASEPFLQRLLKLHRMHYVPVARPEKIAESPMIAEFVAAGVPVDTSELGALVPAWAVEARKQGCLQEAVLDAELQDSLTAELLLRGEV